MTGRNKLVNTWVAAGGVVFTLLLAVAPADARERSQSAKNHFKSAHPCPSNGRRSGPCPGYIIDHTIALACGGADDPSNMQWQTEAAAKAKDRWERNGCDAHAGGDRPSLMAQNNGYFTGPRGGCYTYSASGTKRYVSHDHCR